MERIKKILFLTALVSNFALPVMAEPALGEIPMANPQMGVSVHSAPSLSTLVTPQNVPFEECTKVFNVSADNLFFLAMASINANRVHNSIASRIPLLKYAISRLKPPSSVFTESFKSTSECSNLLSLIKVAYFAKPSLIFLR